MTWLTYFSAVNNELSWKPTKLTLCRIFQESTIYMMWILHCFEIVQLHPEQDDAEFWTSSTFGHFLHTETSEY